MTQGVVSGVTDDDTPHMERTTYIVTARPAERNVASVRVRVRATSARNAEARARECIERETDNHLARLAMGSRPAVRLAAVTYNAVQE